MALDNCIIMWKKIKLDASLIPYNKTYSKWIRKLWKMKLLILKESMGEFSITWGQEKAFTMTKNPGAINLILIYLTTQKQTFA